MKQFKVLCAVFAVILGLQATKTSATSYFATQLYSYAGGNIALRTSWNVSPNADPGCSALTGTICVIAAVAGSGGHPEATSFSNLKTGSNTFVDQFSIAGTNQKVEVRPK